MKRIIKERLRRILDSKLKGIVFINWYGSDLIITVFCANSVNRLNYRMAFQDLIDGKTIKDISEDIIKCYKKEVNKLFFK